MKYEMKDNEIERVQNTHSKGDWVKIHLLPNNVGKRSGTTGVLLKSNFCDIIYEFS